MVDPLPPFPPGFHFGVSTASYQIEGAAGEDGRGRSIWDTFAHTPGRTRDGDTGDVACDHYHRYPEDVALMADLGVDAYRFSVAWPRIQPEGSGPANAKGLDFYDRLVDALGERGLAALPTLFHWDLPQALEDRGGWLSRETALRFGDYVALVADRLGDRVRRWITLNEPVVHMAQGYAFGDHAPGRALGLGALPVAHHQLLGHGLAVRALRGSGSGSGSGEVMITNNLTPVIAEDPAAGMAYDAFHNRLFTDPVLVGSYPAFLADALGDTVREGDLDIISTPMDALGVNYYNPTRVGAPAAADSPLPFETLPIEGVPTTAFGWPVVPSGLYDLLTGLRETYGDRLPPIYITENGCSTPDVLDDEFRVSYLDGHLRAVHQAIADGVDVRGYFVWSLLDNFEWAEGYSQRFGLVQVDFETQQRTPRSSYRWLQAALAARS